MLISGFFLTFSCVRSQKDAVSYELYTILAICAAVSTLGLFIWIRRKITQHYRKRLEERAEVYLKNELAEKDKYIEQLINSNAFLSKVVHRDNHLINSLELTINEYLKSNDEAKNEQMLGEILTLAKERGELIRKEQSDTKVLPATGISLIDGALGNMYVKATAHNIDFNLIVSDEIHYLVNNVISQTDLETLLCDHIKDAIIAIDADKNTSGKILVTIAMVNHIYEISVKDNGVEFEINTLCKLGRERITTHSDTGGSGIGFMTTFETLRKSKASLLITEYKEKQPFSKSITFRFDDLNKFMINSYRKDELAEYINREDLILI